MGSGVGVEERENGPTWLKQECAWCTGGRRRGARSRCKSPHLERLEVTG